MCVHVVFIIIMEEKVVQPSIGNYLYFVLTALYIIITYRYVLQCMYKMYVQCIESINLGNAYCYYLACLVLVRSSFLVCFYLTMRIFSRKKMYIMCIAQGRRRRKEEGSVRSCKEKMKPNNII